MKIIVDGMGGDNAPIEIVKGCINAIKRFDIDIIIVGHEEIIKKELESYTYDKSKIEILHAGEIITNFDDPALAIRRKKDSSMVVGLKALKEGLGDGFLSAGNTGALLAGGLFIIKRINGIERAALTSVYPTSKGISLIVDAGANVDSKPEYLEQFGIMGSVYMEHILDRKNPKVGLVSIGDEKGKGNQLVKESYLLLENAPINFIGNIEARDLPLGEIDVIVADGFVGNVILKLTEGVASFLLAELKTIFTTNIFSKISALLITEGLGNLKKKTDYRQYGGAPLLGTQKPIVKAHGSSDALAIENGIRQLINFIEKDVIKIIENKIQIKD
ncbi:phosphate acyltransferase PlsX [Tissierella creatinophila]|uniref:Phosphate acyltransferase n=1 Tax=Tissierella creatinophila DSM 6911 TaxID=1123403 RepID=A0A1U7M3A5_TISCR|nr:phosphate acyltransferase PlsX [Tissierella creatinophila]OLS01730.1 phosphate acyltransferase [Tissierella creatinophila DSM 6911]